MSTLLHETAVAGQGVEHAAFASFSAPRQLVTTLRNTLCLYDVTADGLVLRCKERLEANVEDLATTVIDGQTLLVLLFREAKVSTLRFDAAENAFRVFSLHWFEQHEKRTRPQCTPTAYNAPRLFVDPDGRCIFVLVYDRLMWVIPLVCGAGLSGRGASPAASRRSRSRSTWRRWGSRGSSTRLRCAATRSRRLRSCT